MDLKVMRVEGRPIALIPSGRKRHVPNCIIEEGIPISLTTKFIINLQFEQLLVLANQGTYRRPSLGF